MKRVWFKAYENKWGWYPVTWQGWTITLVYAAVLASEVGRLSNYVITHSGEPFISLLFPVTLHALFVAALIGSLIFICVKTGERPGSLS